MPVESRTALWYSKQPQNKFMSKNQSWAFLASNNFPPQMSISNCHKLLDLLIKFNFVTIGRFVFWCCFVFCSFAWASKSKLVRTQIAFCQVHPIHVTIHNVGGQKRGRHLGKEMGGICLDSALCSFNQSQDHFYQELIFTLLKTRDSLSFWTNQSDVTKMYVASWC